MHNTHIQTSTYSAHPDAADFDYTIPQPEPWYKRGGWRTAVLWAALATAAVCLLNLSVTIWTLAAHDIVNGNGLLFLGSCRMVKQLNIGTHFIINLFSSVILSGSNFTMQCLAAPTREEIDDAHANGSWLDVGVPSIRNLKRIARTRVFLWVLLAVSSIPLHLFYNSIVFTTLSANQYRVYAINEAWLSDGPSPPSLEEEYYDILIDDFEDEYKMFEDYQQGRLERLEPRRCIDAYMLPFVSNRANVLIVTADNPQNITREAEIFLASVGGAIHITGAMEANNLDPYPWICGDSLSEDTFCDPESLGLLEGSAKWEIGNRTVEYCLSQGTDENCKLQLNITIAIIVTVLNLVKAILMFAVCFRMQERGVMNIGDAIASFLERPAEMTEGSCLLSVDDLKQDKTGHQRVLGPRPFDGERKRWFAAASRRQRLTVYLTSLFGVVACTILFLYGILTMPGAAPSAIWSLGFGVATQHTLMTFQGVRRRMIMVSGILTNVLIANSPQFILSTIYFTGNGFLTSMLLSHEWSSYAHKRKALRVSSRPQGQQRSSYFLQLPWRYAISTIMIGIVLHWLASQSIFIVTVEQWQETYETGAWGHDDFWDFATCAYSPLALFIFICTATAALLVLFALGFRRFRSAMPVAANCSLVIAAACHPCSVRPEPESFAQLPLQWGIVGCSENSDHQVGVYRCAFSSQPVEYPAPGTICG